MMVGGNKSVSSGDGVGSQILIDSQLGVFVGAFCFPCCTQLLPVLSPPGVRLIVCQFLSVLIVTSSP